MSSFQGVLSTCSTGAIVLLVMWSCRGNCETNGGFGVIHYLWTQGVDEKLMWKRLNSCSDCSALCKTSRGIGRLDGVPTYRTESLYEYRTVRKGLLQYCKSTSHFFISLHCSVQYCIGYSVQSVPLPSMRRVRLRGCARHRTPSCSDSPLGRASC